MMALLLALIAVQDDIGSVAQRFMTAVDRPDYRDIKKEADRLAGFNSKKSVEILVKGYAILRDKEPELEKKATELNDKVARLTPNPPSTPIPQDQFDALKMAQADLEIASTKLTACVKGRPYLVEKIAEFTSADAIKEVIDVFSGHKDPALREAACNALRGNLTDAVETDINKAFLARLTKESDPVVKVGIIDGIVKRGIADANAIKEFRRCLKDPSWSIVFSSANALAELNDRESVREIIEALKTADGRLRQSLGNILRKLTGYAYGPDYDGWIAWFDKFGKDYVAGNYQKPEIKDEARGGTATFFGIPIVSKAVCFVCDRSGSMAEDAVWKRKTTTGGTGDLPPDLAAGPSGKRKIDVLKYELKMALYGLPDGTMFNMVFFNQSPKEWKDSLVQLNKSTRAEAFGYIDALQPEGATNIYDSTEMAYRWAEKKGKQKGIDTIMLMSDGFPNFGKFTTGPDVRNGIKELNQNRKLQIDTIFLGTQKDKPGADLLKEIAEDNFGRHVRYLD